MPVLKVKKNGVWEYVGGVAGGSNLPDYTEEDYGKVLSPSAEGLTWAEQTGGNGIIVQPEQPTDVEDGTLWIDTDEEDEDGTSPLWVNITGDATSGYTASSTSAEIYEAAQAHRPVYAVDANLSIFTLLNPGHLANGESVFTAALGSTEYGILITNAYVDVNGNVRTEEYLTKPIPQITESDHGKVLSASAEGLMWADGSGESNVFAVTVDPTTMTASHSASEIYEADLSGKLVLLKPTVSTQDFNGTVVYQGMVKNGDDNLAVFSCLHLMNNRFVDMISGHIDENKACYIYNTYGYLVPHTGEDNIGKVLSTTENGIEWTEPVSEGSGDTDSQSGLVLIGDITINNANATVAEDGKNITLGDSLEEQVVALFAECDKYNLPLAVTMSIPGFVFTSTCGYSSGGNGIGQNIQFISVKDPGAGLLSLYDMRSNVIRTNDTTVANAVTAGYDVNLKYYVQKTVTGGSSLPMAKGAAF